MDFDTYYKRDPGRDPRFAVVDLTRDLIALCTLGDYQAFEKTSDKFLTCFVPETCGSLIRGLDFHKFYFDNVLSQNGRPCNTFILNPYVHMLDDNNACIAFTRLTQYIDRNGEPRSQKSEETLIWQRVDRKWKLVHLHRSVASHQQPRHTASATGCSI